MTTGNISPATGGTECLSPSLDSWVDRSEPAVSVFFPEGILGFPACRRFTLSGAEADGFFWLRAEEQGAPAFLLVDPFRAMEGFVVDLGDPDLHHLQAHHAPDIGILAIVTLPARAGESPTANLQGVVAFNLSRGIGRQVVVQDSPFGTRYPLDLRRYAQPS